MNDCHGLGVKPKDNKDNKENKAQANLTEDVNIVVVSEVNSVRNVTERVVDIGATLHVMLQGMRRYETCPTLVVKCNW